jgi:hypothetical protein
VFIAPIARAISHVVAHRFTDFFACAARIVADIFCQRITRFAAPISDENPNPKNRRADAPAHVADVTRDGWSRQLRVATNDRRAY